MLFHQSALVYASIVLTGVVAFYLARTRWGLNVRAVGESPDAADTMGISVTRYRYVHVLIGGALAGVAGACYSLSITPGWTSGDSLVGGAGGSPSRSSSSPSGARSCACSGPGCTGALGRAPAAIQARDYSVIPMFSGRPSS